MTKTLPSVSPRSLKPSISASAEVEPLPMSSGPVKASQNFEYFWSGSELVTTSGTPAVLILRNDGTIALASAGHTTMASGASPRA